MLSLLFNKAYSKTQVIDTLYVRLDKVKPTLKSYGVFEGRINLVTINIKNKYQSSASFVSGSTNSISLINKNKHSKNLSFTELNKMINTDFFDLLYNKVIFFVLEEDYKNLVLLQVTPITPKVLQRE